MRAEEGLRPALTATSALSPAVVEVTGHAHVLLAAFEKVSATLPLPMPVTWERWAEGCCFESRSLNLGSGPWPDGLSARRSGQVGDSPFILGSRRLGFEAVSPAGGFQRTSGVWRGRVSYRTPCNLPAQGPHTHMEDSPHRPASVWDVEGSPRIVTTRDPSLSHQAHRNLSAWPGP